MKLALECPDELLEMVQPFADFDWISVSRYLNSERYADYYRDSDNIKFVSGSTSETDEPCPIEDLKRVFDDCKGTYVVATDQVGECRKTVEAYKECVGQFSPEVVVGVLQGSTPKEALKCLGAYSSPLVPVAVSCHVGGSIERGSAELMTLRRELVVAHVPADRVVCLLGFAALSELSWYTGRPNVWGISTGVPVRAGLAVQDIDDFDRTQRVKADLNKETWAAICRNIALLRKHMS